MKRILSLILLICIYFSANASHISGAEIWYEHVTANDYNVHLRLYRNCQGLTLGPNQVIGVSSANASINNTATLSQTSSQSMYTCAANTCTNPAAITTGYMIHEYSGTVTLPSAQSDWIFSYSNCCRVSSSNLSGSQATYVKASLDNLSIPFNNGPLSLYPLSLYYPVNVSSTISLAAIEADGDSLDFRLAPVQVNAISSANYTAPSTATTPFPNLALNINAQTGVMTFTPSQLGTFFVGVEVREYRNGILISSTIRDYQFNFVFMTAPNAAPDLSGINNTSSLSSSINACGNSSMSFTINSSDPDANDSTSIAALALPAGATFSANNLQNQVGTFSWSVTQSDVRSQPYFLVLEVRDNNCGVRHRVYQLYVNNCNTDSVWAGDANADFTCDNYDVLNIGIANNATGQVRVGATTNWQAEWCTNWPNNFISNINQKHADCNGDGTVNAADLAAVTANYGQVHTKTSNIGQYKTLGLPDLYCDMSNVQGHKGSTVTIPIMLGTTASLMNDFYGIAASVELLNAQTSAPIGVSKNISWIGNATNSFSFERSLAPNKVAFTFVRNDQQNVSAQQGQIGEITFPIDMASIVGSDVTVQFSDIKIIKSSGEEITDYNVLQDKLTILAPVSTNDITKGFRASVYPNPTKSNMTISLEIDRSQEYKFALYDMVGRLVKGNVYKGELTRGSHNLELDLSKQASGQYQLEIVSESGKHVIPVIKY